MGGSTIKFSLAVTSSSTIYVYLQGRSARLVVYVQSTSHVAAAVHKHEKKWCGYNFASIDSYCGLVLDAGFMDFESRVWIFWSRVMRSIRVLGRRLCGNCGWDQREDGSKGKSEPKCRIHVNVPILRCSPALMRGPLGIGLLG
jgi:hypothetical protein